MMIYNFIKENQENDFHPVTESEIEKVKKTLNLKFPKELIDFYLEVGYGIVEGSEFKINRIMDSCSVRDFRLRVNDFEFCPDMEIYDEFEEDKSLTEFLMKIEEDDQYYLDLLTD